MKLKSIKRYFIRNTKREALHYVQGSFYWLKPTSHENILDLTSFASIQDCKRFINNECAAIKTQLAVGCYIIYIGV